MCPQAVQHASKFKLLRHKLATLLLAKAPVALPSLMPKLLMGSAFTTAATAAALGGWHDPDATTAGHGAGDQDAGFSGPPPFQFVTDSPMPRDATIAEVNAAFSHLGRDPLYQYTSVEAGRPTGRLAWQGTRSAADDASLSEFAAVSSREERAFGAAHSAHSQQQHGLSEDAALLAFANLLGPEGAAA